LWFSGRKNQRCPRGAAGASPPGRCRYRADPTRLRSGDGGSSGRQALPRRSPLDSTLARHRVMTTRFSRSPVTGGCAVFLFVLLGPRWTGSEQPRGSLLLIGGGLRSENEAVFRRFIDLAGGTERAWIGIVATADLEPTSSVSVDLVRYGVPRERIVSINI